MRAAAFIFSLFLSIYFIGGQLPAYASAYSSTVTQVTEKPAQPNSSSLSPHEKIFKANSEGHGNAGLIDIEENDEDHLDRKSPLFIKYLLSFYYSFIISHSTVEHNLFYKLVCYTVYPKYITQRVLRI